MCWVTVRGHGSSYTNLPFNDKHTILHRSDSKAGARVTAWCCLAFPQTGSATEIISVPFNGFPAVLHCIGLHISLWDVFFYYNDYAQLLSSCYGMHVALIKSMFIFRRLFEAYPARLVEDVNGTGPLTAGQCLTAVDDTDVISR